MLPPNLHLPNHFHNFPKSQITVNLLRVICNDANCFPQRGPMMADIRLNNQGGLISLLQHDAGAANILGVVVQAIG